MFLGIEGRAPCGEKSVPGHWFCSSCKTYYACKWRGGLQKKPYGEFVSRERDDSILYKPSVWPMDGIWVTDKVSGLSKETIVGLLNDGLRFREMQSVLHGPDKPDAP